MRFLSFMGAVICAAIAVISIWEDSSGILFPFFSFGAGGFAFFGIRGFREGKGSAGVVLELGGIRWNEEDFCRGWEIDGRTGSGKTASGVVPIIYQLKKNRPDVGI